MEVSNWINEVLNAGTALLVAYAARELRAIRRDISEEIRLYAERNED